MSGLTLSEFWKEHKIAYKERCAKRNNKYEPLIISIGAVKKAKAVYELGEWFTYPTKGFAMNKKDTRKRMRINRFIKKINEGKMKEIEVKTKKYQCENCGVTSSTMAIFSHCKICGKPICKKCGEEVQIYKPDWDDMTGDIYVCKECYKYDYDFWQPVYIAKAKEYEEEYYKKLEELTIEYLKSNDGLMRKYNDKLKVNLY